MVGIDGLVRSYERARVVNNVILVLLYAGITIALFAGVLELVFGLLAVFMLVLVLSAIQNGTLDVIYAIRSMFGDDKKE